MSFIFYIYHLPFTYLKGRDSRFGKRQAKIQFPAFISTSAARPWRSHGSGQRGFIPVSVDPKIKNVRHEASEIISDFGSRTSTEKGWKVSQL